MQERKQVEFEGCLGRDVLSHRSSINELLQLFGKVHEDGNSEFIFIEDEDMVQDASNTNMEDFLPPRPF